MRNDLNEYFVLVTRPLARGIQLCRALQMHGSKTLHFPTIEIESMVEKNNFQNALKELPLQDCIIFVSQHAVQIALPIIKAAYPSSLNHLKFAAVGAATAQLLKNENIRNICYPKENWNSEALLNLEYFKNVDQKKIMIAKGIGGRDLLEKTLKERGANIKLMIAYQRKIPLADTELLHQLLRNSTINAVIISSAASLLHLKSMLDKTDWLLLRHIPIVVVSERIKALAENEGYQTIWVAENASDSAFVKILAEKRISYVRK